MSITRCTKKPVTVRMCGPWDGTDESHAEIQSFVGAANWSANGDAAEVWDELHSTWVKVQLGQYVVQGVKGEFYPIAPDVREATYNVEPATP